MNEPAPMFTYRLTGPEGLDAIQPLWIQLRQYHASWFARFDGEKPSLDFAARRQEFLTKSSGGNLRVELVSLTSEGKNVGYCVSTVTAGGHGELDSMFVDERFRGRGIGAELIRRSLAWMDGLNASSKAVAVAHANERALAFYRRFGFEPRSVTLQQTKVRHVSS